MDITFMKKIVVIIPVYHPDKKFNSTPNAKKAGRCSF